MKSSISSSRSRRNCRADGLIKPAFLAPFTKLFTSSKSTGSRGIGFLLKCLLGGNSFRAITLPASVNV